MIDYGQNKEYIYSIETDIDYPIVIAGIKIGNLLHIAMILLITLFATGDILIAIASFIASIFVFKMATTKELRGEPVTHNEKFVRLVLKTPRFFRENTLPSLIGIDSYENNYRR